MASGRPRGLHGVRFRAAGGLAEDEQQPEPEAPDLVPAQPDARSKGGKKKPQAKQKQKNVIMKQWLRHCK